MKVSSGVASSLWSRIVKCYEKLHLTPCIFLSFLNLPLFFLAGHVKVGDFAVIGGLAAIHQFVRIGHHAMIGGMSGIENDVIPYGQAMGERANLCGLNLVGLKRGNFKREEIHTLRNAYRVLFSQEGTLQERMEDAAEMFKENSCVKEIIDFIRTNGSRAICQPKNDNTKSTDAA